MRLVKGFSMEEKELQRYVDNYNILYRKENRYLDATMFIWYYFSFIGLSFFFVLIYNAGCLYRDGRINAG